MLYKLDTKNRFKRIHRCSKEDSLYDNDPKNMLNNIRHHFHEQILCVVKLYKSGQLSVSPGFSIEEPEDNKDDHIFLSDESIGIRAKYGPRLTTFTFTTSSGSSFQYTLEWKDQVVNAGDLENLRLLEVDEEYKQISDRRKAIFSNISRAKNSMYYGIKDSVLFEFVSAKNFEPLDCGLFGSPSISIRFELTLPSGWMQKIKTNVSQDYNVVVGSTHRVKSSYNTAQFCIDKTLICRLFFIFCIFEWVRSY